MNNVVKPRGRKPAAVYWRRRIVVLAVAAGLVFVLTRLVGGSDDDSAPAAQSRPAASPSAKDPSAKDPSAKAEQTAGESAPPGAAENKQQDEKSKKKSAPASGKQQVTTKLQAPRGQCKVGQVVVVPDVVDTAASRPVPLRLGVSTTADRACTLELSGKDVAMEITSGDDLIWRLSSCPGALGKQELTLRPGWVTYTDVAWNGRRGEDDCAKGNQFARPGYYWAEAALLGGEPARGQFKLEEPPPPKPKDKPKNNPKKDQKNDDGDDDTAQESEASSPRPP